MEKTLVKDKHAFEEDVSTLMQQHGIAPANDLRFLAVLYVEEKAQQYTAYKRAGTADMNDAREYGKLEELYKNNADKDMPAKKHIQELFGEAAVYKSYKTLITEKIEKVLKDKGNSPDEEKIIIDKFIQDLQHIAQEQACMGYFTKNVVARKNSGDISAHRIPRPEKRYVETIEDHEESLEYDEHHRSR